MFRSNRSATIAILLGCCFACAVESAAAFNIYKVDPDCVALGAYATIQAAIDAAAANPGADYVWISNDNGSLTYSGQHITVNDADGVIIEGGFSDCNDFDPGVSYTTISGAGNGGFPVFDIGGGNVYLGNLIIEGGDHGSGVNGGGISFSGSGEVDIAQTYIFLNHADNGGGINVNGTQAGLALVKLLHDTTIYLNGAYDSGGGIWLAGNARLLVVDPKVAINGNTAAQFGGGIAILGPARADIGSAGGGFGDGVVAANYAANGGGIAVKDDGGEAVLRVFADAAHQPSSIVENRATTNGGGIYLSGLADACLFAPRIKSNYAEDGAAIYYTSGTDNSGSGIYFNDGSPTRLGLDCGPDSVADLGGTRDCNAGDDTCNAVIANATQHSDTSPSAGATVFNANGDTIARQIRMHDNIAARVLQVGSAGTTNIYRCLVTDNLASDYLFDISALKADIRACTVANNSIGADYVFNLNTTPSMLLTYQIVDQPGKHTALWTGNPMFAHFFAGPMLTNDAFGLDTVNSQMIVVGAPTFVNAAQRDYHLAPIVQTALDFGYVDKASAFFIPDLDNNVFPPIDLPGIPNNIGTADLGAYERQFLCAADDIFCNGFDG